MRNSCCDIQETRVATWRYRDNRFDSADTLKVKPTEFAYVLDVGYKINDLNDARKNN